MPQQSRNRAEHAGCAVRETSRDTPYDREGDAAGARLGKRPRLRARRALTFIPLESQGLQSRNEHILHDLGTAGRASDRATPQGPAGATPLLEPPEAEGPGRRGGPPRAAGLALLSGVQALALGAGTPNRRLPRIRQPPLPWHGGRPSARKSLREHQASDAASGDMTGPPRAPDPGLPERGLPGCGGRPCPGPCDADM